VRILHVVHQFPPDWVGGTEVYTLNLAKGQARLGHQVAVFHRAAGTQRLVRAEWEGVMVYRAHAGRMTPWSVFQATFGHRGLRRAFSETLADFQPELVHLQHLMGLPVSIVMQAQRQCIPLVLTLHDYWFICSVSQLVWPDARTCQGKALGLNCARCVLSARLASSGTWFLRPLAAPILQIRDTLVRRAALQADSLIAPSRFLIGQYVRTGFPADRFVYLEHGIDAERIQRYPHRPFADGRLRFTYLGSLAWQKGVHILAEAFRDMPPEKAALRIYGDPTVFPSYVAHLRHSANPANTSFEGTVPNTEVGRVLADTDVLVVPSLWYENSPVVIQEAFAAGVPVVASRIGALAEKVQHGVNGLLCTPAKVEAWRATLERLMAEPGLLEHLQANVLPPVTMEEHVSQLESLYLQFTDDSKPGL